MGRGRSALQIDLLLLACANNFDWLQGETPEAVAARERAARREGVTTAYLQDWVDRHSNFVSYAAARRRLFGKATGSQVARTDISRAARRLEREGLVQRMPKGIKITEAGNAWLHQWRFPEIAQDYMWRTIKALETKRFNADDIAWAILLIWLNALKKYSDMRFDAAPIDPCERLFYALKALPIDLANMPWPSKRPGPPGSLLTSR